MDSSNITIQSPHGVEEPVTISTKECMSLQQYIQFQYNYNTHTISLLVSDKMSLVKTVRNRHN